MAYWDCEGRQCVESLTMAMANYLYQPHSHPGALRLILANEQAEVPLRVVAVMRCAAKFQIVNRRLAARGVRDDMVELESPGLAASAGVSFELALATVAR